MITIFPSTDVLEIIEETYGAELNMSLRELPKGLAMKILDIGLDVIVPDEECRGVIYLLQFLG